MSTADLLAQRSSREQTKEPMTDAASFIVYAMLYLPLSDH